MIRALSLASLLLLAPASQAQTPDAAPLEQTVQRGPVSATLRLSPGQPVIGDELRLELEVVAEEGVELLMPEFGEALDRFRIRDFAQREFVDDLARTRSLQVYTLASPMSGTQRVPPLQVEFVDRRPGQTPAPQDEDAYELLTERLDFEVASVLPAGAVPELPPPPEALAPLDRGVRTIAWLALGALTLLALVAAPFAIREIQRRRALARQQSAWQIADARLRALLERGLPQGPEQVDAFYVELSDTVRTYLEDRFDLRSPELTTEEFFELARMSPDLTPELQGLLKQFLEHADLVKFARHVPGDAETEAASASVRRVLEQTRQGRDDEPVAAPAREAARA